MIIIGSSNGRVGIAAGWAILQAGGSALDAVEAATRLVEDNPDDHSVGYGGYPNLLGEVELDASIMDGTTLRAGVVGALIRVSCRHQRSPACDGTPATCCAGRRRRCALCC